MDHIRRIQRPSGSEPSKSLIPALDQSKEQVYMSSAPDPHGPADRAPNPASNLTPNTAPNTVLNTPSPSLAVRLRDAIATGVGGAGPDVLRDESPVASTGNKSRRRYISESEFRDDAIQRLDRSRRLAERSKSAKEISQELLYYPVDIVMDIWAVAKDLSEKDAPLEARIAGFILLGASASHSGLGSTERMEMYNSIAVVVDGACVAMQCEALNGLTNNGDNLDPFKTPLILFLNTTLKSQFEFVSRRRSESRNTPERRSREPLDGENGMKAILTFLTKVITKNRDAIYGDNLAITVSRLLLVAQKTTSKPDMKGAIESLVAILKFSQFPESHLKTCIEVLCAVTRTVNDLAKLSWESMLGLLRNSSQQRKTLEILLATLFNSPQDKTSSTTQGALRLVTFLILNNGAKDLPKVSSSQLVTGLWEVHFVSSSLKRDCLKDIDSLLGAANSTEQIEQKDWETIIRILITSTGSYEYVKDIAHPVNRRVTLFSRSPQAISIHESEDEPKLQEDIVNELQSIADNLVDLWPKLNPERRVWVRKFFSEFRAHLPVSALKLFVQLIAEDNLRNPGTDEWRKAEESLVNGFLLDKNQHHSIRCLILQILKDSLASLSTADDLKYYRKLFSDIMAGLEGDKCLEAINEFAALVELYLHNVETEEVEVFVVGLTSMSILEVTESPSSAELNGEPVLNTVATSLVELFLHFCLYPLGKRSSSTML